MSNSDNPREEAAGELDLARVALNEGDLERAALHASIALYHAPSLPEVHELLATLGDPALFPLGGVSYAATAIAHAHLLAAAGEHTEALLILADVQRQDPERLWAAVPWVLDPALPARMSPNDLIGRVGLLFDILEDPVDEAIKPALEPYVQLLNNAVATYPDNPVLLANASMFVRRMGYLERGTELAERADAIEPTFQTAHALGYAYRSQERIDEAVEAWSRASSLDPSNLGLMTDIGELLDVFGRPEEGLVWVERVLAIDPKDQNAFPTACDIRHRVENNIRYAVVLADFLSEYPENAHAAHLLWHMSLARYWTSEIPPPEESVVDRLEDSSGQLTIPAPDSPSALLVLNRIRPNSTITIAERPQPDPGLPVMESWPEVPLPSPTYAVWNRDGKPAVPPPSKEAVERLRTYGQWRWRHLPGAFQDARRLASLPLSDLLGVLVHPPDPPDSTDWPSWLRNVQAWACLGIARHQPDEPWMGSTRRQVLLDLAFGPEDWVSEAAVFALVATAWSDRDPEVRVDICAAVVWRFVAALRANATRDVSIVGSLGLLVLITPGMPQHHLDLALGKPRS